MIEFSDYMYLQGCAHVAFAIGFTTFFLTIYKEEILPKPSRADIVPKGPIVEQDHPVAFVRKINSYVTNTLGGLGKTSMRFGFLSLFVLFAFFTVGTYVKYTEKFNCVQTVNSTTVITDANSLDSTALSACSSFITKEVAEYTTYNAGVVKFSDFLINIYWGTRMPFAHYFLNHFRKNMDAVRSSEQRDQTYGAMSVIFMPILFLLQIVLAAAKVSNAWLPTQIVFTVVFTTFIWRFSSTYSIYRKSIADQEKDLIFAENIKWSYLLFLTEYLSLVCLCIGNLVGLNQDTVYFQSKFVEDFIMTIWIFALCTSTLIAAYLMFHTPVRVPLASRAAKSPSAITIEASVHQYMNNSKGEEKSKQHS